MAAREHSKPARVTPELLDELEALVPLAPLHEPHNLAPIRMALAMNPELPQVACFDTAFHRTAPEVAQAFALPYALYEEGVRRYGFHGLSYEYIASVLPERAPEIAGGRVVVAHLGNGCSACAMQAGRSVATTMGFTALDGLPMGTRCGALDPGVVLYLIQQKGMSPDAVTDLLYRRSGMLGMSGVSSDFRELLASVEPRARFAVDSFCYWTARQIASLAAALGGFDGIVFTAGVGENAASIRAAICRACNWLGVELDEAANGTHRTRITTQCQPRRRVCHQDRRKSDDRPARPRLLCVKRAGGSAPTRMATGQPGSGGDSVYPVALCRFGSTITMHPARPHDRRTCKSSAE